MKSKELLVIEPLLTTPIWKRQIEIVERKGLGHPDSICDGVMEHISVRLANEYQKNFGRVLHHNLDKSLLAAGSVDLEFGGGMMKAPMRLIMGDRATWKVDSKEIPVADIAISTAKEWFRKNLRHVNPDQHIEYQIEIRQGSSELQGIFAAKGRFQAANDTSAGVGYAPLSPTEKIVLDTESFLNSQTFKQKFPDTGEDVKIMAIRRSKDLSMTIAMPLISRCIRSEKEYFDRKVELLKVIRQHLNQLNHSLRDVKLFLNSLDKRGKGIDGVYVSLLGTSAESGDSGEVGRGNRVNGLIAFGRPSSLEAAAGKNATSHVGKIYNVLANKLASQIYAEVPGIEEIIITLVSRIGLPINQPSIVSVQLNLKHGKRFSTIAKQTSSIIEKEFSQLHLFCNQLLEGKLKVY
jgi:S-adenosylmethionine synthetase